VQQALGSGLRCRPDAVPPLPQPISFTRVSVDSPRECALEVCFPYCRPGKRRNGRALRGRGGGQFRGQGGANPGVSSWLAPLQAGGKRGVAEACLY